MRSPGRNRKHGRWNGAQFRTLAGPSAIATSPYHRNRRDVTNAPANAARFGPCARPAGRRLLRARAVRGHRPVRHRDRQWPHHRWNGIALVRGRPRDPRRQDRGDREAGRRFGLATRRRARDGRRARFHRHAGTVGAHDPREPAPALEDLPGHHHRGHGRGRIGGPARQRDRRRRPRELPASRHHARLANVRTILRAHREAGDGNQPGELRGRHAGAAHGTRRCRQAAHGGRTRQHEGAGARGDARRRGRRLDVPSIRARTVRKHARN